MALEFHGEWSQVIKDFSGVGTAASNKGTICGLYLAGKVFNRRSQQEACVTSHLKSVVHPNKLKATEDSWFFR
jgi:hypothetical protein